MRITPACAGKTGEVGYVEKASKDHPRVCGENKSVYSGFFSLKGSPPRVRGKLTSILSEFTEHRITPACAGKTFTY